jgi:hypothetical protein
MKCGLQACFGGDAEEDHPRYQFWYMRSHQHDTGLVDNVVPLLLTIVKERRP